MELLTEQELQDLTGFFANSKDLPKQVQLYIGTKIVDVPGFIKSQLNLLQSDISQTVQKPALERIRKLRELLDPVNGE